jgi:hypothetical protein
MHMDVTIEYKSEQGLEYPKYIKPNHNNKVLVSRDYLRQYSSELDFPVWTCIGLSTLYFTKKVNLFKPPPHVTKLQWWRLNWRLFKTKVLLKSGLYELLYTDTLWVLKLADNKYKVYFDQPEEDIVNDTQLYFWNPNSYCYEINSIDVFDIKHTASIASTIYSSLGKF